MSGLRYKAYGLVTGPNDGGYKMLGTFAKLNEARRAIDNTSGLDTWEIVDQKTQDVVESSEAVELAIYYANGIFKPPTSVELGGEIRTGSMVMVKFFPTLDKCNEYIRALEAEHDTVLLNGTGV